MTADNHEQTIREALSFMPDSEVLLFEEAVTALDALLADVRREREQHAEEIRRLEDRRVSAQSDSDGFKSLYYEARAENSALRGIASKIMPCHYCGVEEIASCWRGFPGCALMDDVMGMEEGVMDALREARAENERLRPVVKKLADRGYLFVEPCGTCIRCEAIAALAAAQEPPADGGDRRG